MKDKKQTRKELEQELEELKEAYSSLKALYQTGLAERKLAAPITYQNPSTRRNSRN